MPIGQQDPLDLLLLLLSFNQNRGLSPFGRSLGGGGLAAAPPQINRSGIVSGDQSPTPSTAGGAPGYGKAPSFGEMLGIGKVAGGLLGKAVDFGVSKLAGPAPFGPIGMMNLGTMLNNAIVDVFGLPTKVGNPLAGVPTPEEISIMRDRAPLQAAAMQSRLDAALDAMRSNAQMNPELSMTGWFGGNVGDANGPGAGDRGGGSMGGLGGAESGGGADFAKGGVIRADSPQTIRVGETPESRGEYGVFVPPGMLAPGMQQNEQQVTQTMQQLLGRLQGGQGMDPTVAMVYGAGEDFGNMGLYDKLRYIGQQMLQRRLGVPPQDTMANSLIRMNILEKLREQQMRNQALAPFGGDPSRIFEPEVSRKYIPTGETDETGTAYMSPYETRTYSPQKKMAARVLYGTNLEDTDPLAEARFRESLAQHQYLREQGEERLRQGREVSEQRQVLGEEKLALAKDAEERRKEATTAREEERKANIKIRKQQSLNAAFGLVQQMEYDPETISAAAEKAIDEEGYLNQIEFYRNLPKGEPPKVKRMKEAHNQRMKHLEASLEISRKNANRLYEQTKDADGYRQYVAAARNWEQQFKAFQGDLNNIGQPFTIPVPRPEDFITPSLQQRIQAPGRKPTQRDVREGGSPSAGTITEQEIVDKLIYGGS